MGTSTNAVLFYGYCWEDGEGLEFDREQVSLDAVVKRVLTGRGMTDPWDAHYSGDQPYENYKAWAATPQGTAEVDAWRAAEKQEEDRIGVEWGDHCSGDYPIPYLYAKGTESTSYRGDRTALTAGDLAVDPSWKERLDAFLASQGIEPPAGENQPGWWMVSYWG